MFCDWELVNKDQVLTNLRAIKELFSNSNNWIGWPLALNSKGLEVSPHALDAVKWCLMGASDKFTSALYPNPLSAFVDCATRDYLNELSGENLIHQILSYEDEFALICLALEELEKNA